MHAYDRRFRPTRRAVVLAGIALLVASGCGETDADGPDTVASADAAAEDAAADAAGDDAADDATDTDGDATAADGADASETVEYPCPGSPGCPCDTETPCDGLNDACWIDPVCEDGFCSGPSERVCDDGVACTDDGCDAGTGCVHAPRSGACDDGNPCTYADQCASGACAPGPALDCSDGDPCTDDACVPVVGCQHVHNTAVCWDGNACVADSVCAVGQCVAGKVAPCSDGNGCTVDRCMPEEGCVSLPWTVSPSCDGGVQQGDRCFRAHAAKDGIDWLQARVACAAQGDVLAVLPSRPDELAARAAVASACGEANAWVGLDDRIRNGVWRWSDNSGLLWRNWNPGEPNNAGGEDVVELVAGAGWNDVAASQKRGCYVCMRRVAMGCSGPACQAGGLCAAGACGLPAPLPLPGTAVDLTDSPTPTACDDRDPCTLDACAKAGCTHVTLPDGASCTDDGGVCNAGACVLPTPLGPAPTSCAAVLDADPSAPTGVYVLADGAGGSYAALCEMSSAGGGWTLALKVAPDAADFAYDGKAWADAAPLAADKAGKEASTARLWSYGGLAVQQVLVRLVVGGVAREVVVPLPGASLHALLGGKDATETSLGAPAWRTLVPKPGLQPSCQLEGALAGAGGARVRLGVVGNNENDCKTSDSWIGVGGSPGICGGTGLVAGNVACHGASAKTGAFAYVFVR